MKAQLNSVLFTSVVCSFTIVEPVFAKAESVPNRVLVKFKNSQTLGQSLKSLAQFRSMHQQDDSLRVLGHLQELNTFEHGLSVLRFSSNLEALQAAKSLRINSLVEFAQPDYMFRIFPLYSVRSEQNKSLFSRINFLKLYDEPVTPIASDPALPEIPELPSPPVTDPDLAQAWGLSKIEAISTWTEQSGSRKIVVADIDTGTDYTHPDLVNNLWSNPNPTNGDEIGYDFANKDPWPFDDQGHGTHTAGTIGATGANGIGISGVSPAVSIMTLKFISKEGFGTTSDAIASIDYAIANGARVMSNSWGGESDQGEEDKALTEAVERAEAADILFVAAAGNDGTDNDTRPMIPAAIKRANVLTVASSTNRDTRSFFSNFGKETVHVAAPGSNVYSTIPGGKYAQFSGTSMACPHVAGLAALILAERPELSAVQVKEIIMATVDPLQAFSGKIVTGGRVNARAALLKARNYSF